MKSHSKYDKGGPYFVVWRSDKYSGSLDGRVYTDKESAIDYAKGLCVQEGRETWLLKPAVRYKAVPEEEAYE